MLMLTINDKISLDLDAIELQVEPIVSENKYVVIINNSCFLELNVEEYSKLSEAIKHQWNLAMSAKNKNSFKDFINKYENAINELE